jgi:hypothetical protein
MNDLVNIKKNKNAATPKQLQEKFERERLKAEEKEKLKLLEKLESQVVKMKKKLPSLNNEKRLMDSLTSMKNEFRKESGEKGFDSSGLKTDVLLKKPSKKEKIEIIEDEDSSNINEDDINLDERLDSEFIKNCSKEIMSFYFIKVREVYDFLISIKLFRYIDIFIQDGFEDLETICEIDQGYFKEREYPEQHKLRILNRVAELRGLNNELFVSELGDRENKPIDIVDNGAQEFSTEANFDNLLPVGIDKECCWNCLKVIVKDNAISHSFEEKVIKLKVVNLSLT